MKKYFLLGVLTCFAFLLTACFGGNKVDISCKTTNKRVDCFYEDSNYEYCFSYTGNYVMKGKEKLTPKDAIEKKVVTIEDFEKKGCELFKIKKD